MAKILFFSPMILFFGFFLLLVIGFFTLVFKLINKAKNSSWAGVVTDKKHNQKRDMDSNRIENFYYLVVKTDEGREMKVGLSPQMFDNFAVGDKIQKPKGKLYPEKV